MHYQKERGVNTRLQLTIRGVGSTANLTLEHLDRHCVESSLADE